ncbi:MAG: uracil phosphoribosyltransferase [Proteobacteria bacterium]|nr:uracil phosphoribosyltransferase [Pseudomonadota bacterium]
MTRFPNVHVVSHPLVLHKLTLMRQKETPSSEFRRLLREISVFLAYEATATLPLHQVEIETPITKMQAPMIEGKKIVIISVLRAGNGILDGMIDVIPSARVGHIGLYRDPKTLIPVEYYFKVPENLGDRDVIVVDPMLATGNSAAAAVSRIKGLNPKSIQFVSLLAAPEGIKNFHADHPEVRVITVAIDERLNEHAYIVPGLGDAGDRLFGTK